MPDLTPTMLDATQTMSASATIDEEYTSIYLSCVCFNCIYCFSYSYSLTLCLFVHLSQQSFIINNNVDASAINIIANMAIASLLQVQPEHQLEGKPTMTMTIAA